MEVHQLFDAVWDGNVDEVRRLVGRHGMDPNIEIFETPLQIASLEGHFPVVQYLVENAEVQIDKKNSDGWSALHFACNFNHHLIAEYLIETGGANLETQTNRGETPLHKAAKHRSKALVRYLVEEQQANVDARDEDGETPLDTASRFKSSDVVRYLLPRTSSVTARTLVDVWKHDCVADIGAMVLEKYALGRGQANAFHRIPIHTLLSKFPLPSAKAFHDYIKLFPTSVFSLLNAVNRLPIHVAFTSQKPSVKSPKVIFCLFMREPRSALARDPKTGLYPHETAAGLVSNNDDDGCYLRWLALVYKMFRSNPQHFLQSRTEAFVRLRARRVSDEGCVEDLPMRKRSKVESIL